MAARKGGLGKGLDALFVDNAADQTEKVVTLRVSEIEPNRDQPRKVFEEKALHELADSIAQHGVLQPLMVRPIAGGGYQLVAGERRWRAARIAGLPEVPVVVREMDDAEMTEIALIENLQREDLNPVEEAEGYRTLMENYGLTQDQAAARVGKSRPAVANAMRLLQLPPDLLEKVQQGQISAGHARTLLAFPDEESMRGAADAIIEQGISVRELEKWVKKAVRQGNKTPAAPAAARRASFYDEVELALTEHLNRRVQVVEGKQKGTLEIEFYSESDLRSLANTIVPIEE